MSFSGEVKKELTEHVSKSRHCQLAELAAFLNFSGIKAGMGNTVFCPLNRRTKSWLENTLL